MSTPNPLIPQGTFQAQASKGASNVRIAVATIVAIHVVFFGGLLLQGCKRDVQVAANPETNQAPSNLSLPPMETYYSNAASLPPDSSSSLYTSAPSATVEATSAIPSSATGSFRDTLAPSTLTPQTTYVPEPPSESMKEYTIVRGDSFSKIAAAHGTTVNALKQANPGVDPLRIRPGNRIMIPPAAAPASAQSFNAAPVSGGEANGNVYTVKAGDTLTRVAKNHGVTISQLRAANNLRTSGLKIGQKLKIPAASTNGGTTTNGTRL
jgi:LysM repeat protein